MTNMTRNQWLFIAGSFLAIDLMNVTGNSYTNIMITTIILAFLGSLAGLGYFIGLVILKSIHILREINTIIEDHSGPNLNRIWVQKHYRK